MNLRIISIGALAMHELWPRQAAVRTAHATTTLIESGDRRILIDPGLPPQVIAARLGERAGLEPTDITDVFLTCFRPEQRRGLTGLPDARWLIAEAERERVGHALLERFASESDQDTRTLLQQDIALLKRCTAAPDQLARGVDLFPLPGYTPGTCGLLLSFPRITTLIAGPAVATCEHLEHGRVLRGAMDIEQAQESLLEAMEIADQIIPGYDNILVNPGRRGL